MTLLLRGLPLELHPTGDYLSDEVRRTGDFFEPSILDDLRERVAGGTVVDVGAMLGNHTAYFAAFGIGDTIHAFEPLPANLALLRRNVAAWPQVTVHAVALSDREGRARMVAESSNLGHARITDRGPFGVRTRTLDSYGFCDVSLLKVDVEGHERQVLEGARVTLRESRPLVLIEDWTGKGGAWLPDYRLVRDWERTHQTYLYAPR